MKFSQVICVLMLEVINVNKKKKQCFEYEVFVLF